MTNLVLQVEDFAQLCLPDYLCLLPSLRDELMFDVVDFDDGDTGLTGTEVVLRINGDDHLCTDWSRMQLLSHLGTREKWFAKVMKQDQASELTLRAHCFEGSRLRRMQSKTEGLWLLRGIVSKEYGDIPDTDIMQAVLAALPNGRHITHLSGKSDRAFYGYLVADHSPIGLPKTFSGYPGVLIKNSEVGSCSLWVMPFFYAYSTRCKFGVPVIFRQRAMLRKVHRGKAADLAKSLSEALDKISSTWGSMQKRLEGLKLKTFADEDLAMGELARILTALKVPKVFAYACLRKYEMAGHAKHDGAALFAAVLEACASTNLDAAYDQAEIAGAVLLYLL